MPSAEPAPAPGSRQARPLSGGLAYHQLHRLAAPGLWRSVVGVVALVLLLWAVLPVPILAAISPGNYDGHPVTPRYLAATNVWWALAIPLVCLLTRIVQQLSPKWLYSVVACFRWRWFALCLLVAVVTLAVTSWVSAALPSQGPATVDFSGHLHPWTAQLRDFVLIVLLLTPLQAAGEEFVFRGYLTQSIGSLGVRLSDRTRQVIAVVLPALLFALAHGVQDGPIFFDRFAFGLVAGTLVLVTGGLEAGIAMHVLNNFLSFGLALFLGDITATMHVQHGSWWAIPVTLVQSLLYLALVWWLSRKVGLKRRTGEGVLEAGRGAR